MNDRAHPSADLSAYLDGALTPAERAAVASHLDTCALCRGRLAELRGTASLVARLPDPLPARRLVPRVGRVPAWLAPLRTLSALACGVSVFVLATSVLLGSAEQAVRTGAASALLASEAPERNAAGAPAPAPTAGPTAAQDSAKLARPTASAASSGASPSPTATLAGVATADGAREVRAPAVPLSPWLWLAAAVLTGGLAIALQRRLDRA